MAKKTIPFTRGKIEAIIAEFGTPTYVYDEAGIRAMARELNSAFGWVPGIGFKNHFAVKACPNPNILAVVKEEGMGTDCSSLPELIMSGRVGITGEEIMFSSNDTPPREFQEARLLGAMINLDDIEHIQVLEDVGIPELICFRYNPGKERTGNEIIGQPVEAKYGLTKEQMFKAYRIMRDKGVRRFGMHTMVASNELNSQYFVETGRMLLDLVVAISRKHGIAFEFINLGGGIGIPYRPEQEPVDLEFVSEGLQGLYEEKIERYGLPPLRVIMECGRLITGPHGILVTRVRHVMKKHKNYVGLDACMADLMRPGMYGKDCYHHITVLGKEDAPRDHVYDVVGSLCENCDKFAVDRPLPKIERGDIVVIHDTGAHGRAMGFNYNGKLRPGEVLVRPDCSSQLIRRPETVDDYFATLVWPDQS